MDEQQLTMRALVDEINRASRFYYVEDKPIMSDAQWDTLYARLQRMEQEQGLVLPDSPSRRVGGEPLAGFRQHSHLSRLWSLDKVQSIEALQDWFQRCAQRYAAIGGLAPLRYALEYKYDGLTINLTYREGTLQLAATRGNGIVGEDITAQALTIRGIPLSIPYQGTMEIHGECVMRLSEFERYNKTAQEPLKNARNAAAGALRNLDPQVTASRRLSAYFYEIGFIEDPPYANQEQMQAFIRECGFPVSPILCMADQPETIVDQVVAVERRREQLDFLIDGLVIKVDDKATRSAFGYTDKFPRWAVAFKFEAQENITTLEQVVWEPGRTGKLTPLAHVAAVTFDGVTVRRATLNNWGDIQRKRLKLGAHVWIRRSNDVIPEIMGLVEDGPAGSDIMKPDHCPACGSVLVETGAHLFCPNRDGCKPQVVARLTHFAGRDAMDIAGLSDKTAALLYNRLNIREADALYTLSKEQLLSLPGFLDRRADKLLEAIQASKSCMLDAFVFAIGIPNIGRGTARDIASHFGTLEKLRQADLPSLAQVAGVGDVLAQSIVDFFADHQNARLIDSLLALGVLPHTNDGVAEDAALSGKTLVVTGTLPTMSRQQAEDMIRSHGGIAASAVSRKTAYLIAGENAGSKLQKAQALGIPVLNEEDFLAMLGCHAGWQGIGG